MEIIEKGRIQKGWTKEFVCTGKEMGGGGCGAKLLVSEGDLREVADYSFPGGPIYQTVFFCPCCGVKTKINGVPYSILCRMGHRRWESMTS